MQIAEMNLSKKLFGHFFIHQKLQKRSCYFSHIYNSSKVTAPNVNSIFRFSGFWLKIIYKFVKDLYRVLSQNPENLKIDFTFVAVTFELL